DLGGGGGEEVGRGWVGSGTVGWVGALYRPPRSSAVRSACVTSGLHDRPKPSAATRSGSVSSPVTQKPAAANSAATGRPTYPWPTTASRAVRRSMPWFSV